MHYFKGAQTPPGGPNKVSLAPWHVAVIILSVCVYMSIHVCFYKPDYLYMRMYPSIGLSIRTYAYILKPSSNRCPYIFMLVQKVKHRVYKIYAFSNDAILFQDSASYFILKMTCTSCTDEVREKGTLISKSYTFSTI